MYKLRNMQLTLPSTFEFKQALLHLRHMDGLSTALLATQFLLRLACVEVGLTITPSASRYGLFVASKSCSTAVRRESNRFKEQHVKPSEAKVRIKLNDKPKRRTDDPFPLLVSMIADFLVQESERLRHDLAYISGNTRRNVDLFLYIGYSLSWQFRSIVELFADVSGRGVIREGLI